MIGNLDGNMYLMIKKEDDKMDNFEIVFESERIYFVKLSYDLVNEYLNMVNNEEVQRFISKKRKKYTIEEEIEWVKCKLEEKAIIFSMIDKETNEYIGNVEIMNINNDFGTLGISITPNKQDMHFGQEAITAIFKYAINNLKLNGLDLNVFNYNTRAIHCYEKLGFKVIGKGETDEDIKMIRKK